MSINYNEKKFFIQAFRDYIKNEHKLLSKIYNPSIREVLMEYIEIHKDITENLEQTKLENARQELIEMMKYYIKDSLLYSNTIYSSELKLLLDELNIVISNDEKGNSKFSVIYTCCNTLIKKINRSNIYSEIINILKRTSNYGKIEKAIHCIISELLYDGYSLKFLDKWFNKNIGVNQLTEDNCDEILEKFNGLKKTVKVFEYYINIRKGNYFNESKIYVGFNILLEKQDINTLTLSDTFTKDEGKKFLQNSTNYQIYKIKINATDYFKGIDIILKLINSYFHAIHYIYSIDEKIILEKVVCVLPDGRIEKINLGKTHLSLDTDIFFSNIETREKQDVEDFIVYRDKIFREGWINSEFNNIQRALNIIKSQYNQPSENKIINLWAVAEYLLTFKDSTGSIISKVQNTIPKIICLYIMKDKLNIFWNRLFQHQKNPSMTIQAFLECKKDNESYEYDLIKLTNFIKEKGEALSKELEFNAFLHRDFLEIGMLLDDSKKLVTYLETKEKQIKNDLTRIYRTRNILIHSGKETKIDLDSQSLRLYMYNNGLIGLIIYYMSKDPYLEIKEILSSIDYSYNNYIEKIKNNDLTTLEICKPKYLFIG